MQRFPETWSDLTKINFLQRKILLYILHLKTLDSLNVNKKVKSIAKQLYEMQCNCKNYEDSRYYYSFKDFKGDIIDYSLWFNLTYEDKLLLINLGK